MASSDLSPSSVSLIFPSRARGGSYANVGGEPRKLTYIVILASDKLRG